MRDEPFPPTDFIGELTRWTLENNIFLFQEQLYRQTRGTAMGVTYAPSYANLFLGVWEDKFIRSPVNPYRDKIKWFGRYIDDLIFFMQCEEHEVLDFHKYLNNTNKSLKLSLEYSKRDISFLDLRIMKTDDGDLHTTIYRKVTDRNTMLRVIVSIPRPL